MTDLSLLRSSPSLADGLPFINNNNSRNINADEQSRSSSVTNNLSSRSDTQDPNVSEWEQVNNSSLSGSFLNINTRSNTNDDTDSQIRRRTYHATVKEEFEPQLESGSYFGEFEPELSFGRGNNHGSNAIVKDEFIQSETESANIDVSVDDEEDENEDEEYEYNGSESNVSSSESEFDSEVETDDAEFVGFADEHQPEHDLDHGHGHDHDKENDNYEQEGEDSEDDNYEQEDEESEDDEGDNRNEEEDVVFLKEIRNPSVRVTSWINNTLAFAVSGPGAIGMQRQEEQTNDDDTDSIRSRTPTREELVNALNTTHPSSDPESESGSVVVLKETRARRRLSERGLTIHSGSRDHQITQFLVQPQEYQSSQITPIMLTSTFAAIVIVLTMSIRFFLDVWDSNTFWAPVSMASSKSQRFFCLVANFGDASKCSPSENAVLANYLACFLAGCVFTCFMLALLTLAFSFGFFALKMVASWL
ncbi:unnamed protein product [Ambrosiozyma monospora]|uniref:Unnamed protein product n=1 Tax=Ambrosiozyma monospora TaxID=43982 RepID=A0A9W7DIL1_AMBMO|nr:unnamed protein product [Ambrosiozyma monospora]